MVEQTGKDPEQEPVAIHPQDIATRLAAYRRRAASTATKDVIIDLTHSDEDVVRLEAPDGAVLVLPEAEPDRDEDA
jgi:hypothetical protein